MRLFNKEPKHPHRSLLAIALIGTGLFSLSACKHDDDESDISSQAMYQVTVHNLTHGQPLTPLGVVIHGSVYSPWQLGSSASVGLETLAESGNPSAFISEAQGNTAVVSTSSSSNGPFGPGTSESLTLTVDHNSMLQLSVASMLANTNDAFTGVGNWSIGGLAVGESSSTLSSVFDAGTEANSETAATMPGPAAMGEGFNTMRDDLDKVTIHRGVVTADDGLAGSALDESHRWLGMAAKIVVTRLQ